MFPPRWLCALLCPIGNRLRPRRRGRFVPWLLPLEERVAPSVVPEIEPNDTFATTNAVPIVTGDVLDTNATDWLRIAAAISGPGDADYYRFTLTGSRGVFLDIDSRETGLSTTLDAVLELLDASGTSLGTNDNGYDLKGFTPPATSQASAVGPDSSLYLDLPEGTYTVRTTGAAGTTGSYELRILADSGYTTAVPALDSYPGATHTFYLDCNGHGATDTWGTYTAAPFDFNGDAARFTPAERLAIQNLWRVTADDFSPFAVNVTTVDPGSFGDGQAFRGVITSSAPAVIGRPAGTLGAAFFNSYTGPQVNTAFTFAESFGAYMGGQLGLSGRIVAAALEQANTTSQQLAIALGLETYSSNGVGQGSVVPHAILANPDLGLNREKWVIGDTTETNSIQNDMTLLQGKLTFRADDHGDTLGTATALAAAGGTYTASGVIANIRGAAADRDYFRFQGSGSTAISVGVDPYAGNLDAELRLYDADGVLLATDDPAASFTAALTRTLDAGTYFIEVRSDQQEGEAGQYTVRIDTTPPTTATTTISLDGSGNLVITDSAGGDSDDSLTLQSDTTNARFVISDPNNVLATSISGATGNNTHTVTVPFAAVIGLQILVDTRAGDDVLTVDLSLGRFARNVSYTADGPGDGLTVTGGSFATVTHTLTGATTGNLLLDDGISPTVTIGYTGVERALDVRGMSVATLVFNLPAAATTAFLEDDGTAANGVSRLRGDNGTFATTLFANPAAGGSLAVNRGHLADTLTVKALPDFTRGLTVASPAAAFAMVTLDSTPTALTLATGSSLTIDALAVEVRPGASVQTSGAGTIALRAVDRLLLGVGASLATAGAAVTLGGDNLMVSDTATVNASGGTVTVRQATDTTVLDLGGTDSSSVLGLTDAELDRIIAGRIVLGDVARAGGITVSAAIDRAAPTALDLRTGGAITFTAGSLATGGGDASLTTGAAGGISASLAGTAVTAGAVTLAVGSTGIGSLTKPLRLAAVTLTTGRTGGSADQFLIEADTVTVAALDAGTGTVALLGGTFGLGASDAIADATAIDVKGGILGIGAHDDTVAGVRLTNGSIVGTSGTLTSTSTFDVQGGTVTARLGGEVGLTKSTAGAVTLAGLNTFAGPADIDTGTLEVTGALAASSAAVTVKAGATLGGNGTVNRPVVVAGGGAVAPGSGPGVLRTGTTTFASGSTLIVEIAGNSLTPVPLYDQLAVSGNIALDNATLDVIRAPGFVPAVGDQFPIVANDGNNSGGGDGVSGTFVQGNSLVAGGISCRIEYAGGDGNDVVLTVEAPPVVYVDDNWTGTAPGAAPVAAPVGGLVFGYTAFATLPTAVAQVAPGGTVIVHGGTYAGLPEEAQVSDGTFAGIVGYAGVDGNDVTLAAAGPASFTGSGALVLRRSGGSMQFLRDGAVLDTRPLAAVTDYAVTGDGGPTTLTLDFAFGGFFTVGGRIRFDGGPGGRARLLVAGESLDRADLSLTGTGGGMLALRGRDGSTVRVEYAGLESVDLASTAPTDLAVRLSDGNDRATLDDDDAAGVLRFAGTGSTFPAVRFRAPAAGLLLDLGGGDDGLTVRQTRPSDTALTIEGGVGRNALTLDLSAPGGPRVLSLTHDTVRGNAMSGGISYRATGGSFGDGVTLHLGDDNDTVFVQGTLRDAPTLVQTGGGDDTILVSSDPDLSRGSMHTLAAPLTIDAGTGANRLVVSAAVGPADRYWLNAHGVAGTTVPFRVFFSATGGSFARGVDLVTGPGDDTIVVQGQAQTAPTTVYGGAGQDAFHVAVTEGSAYDRLTLDGGTGDDGLFVHDQSGAAVMHDRVTVIGLGAVEVSYLGELTFRVAYQNLEDCFPSVDAAASFIQALFNTSLEFRAAPADLAFWREVLVSAGREAVVQGIERSLPARAQVVRRWFARYLGHAPAPEAEQIWAARLQANAQEYVLAELLATDEYYLHAGGTDGAFAQRLYEDLLGRPASEGDLTLALRDVLPRAGRTGLAWLVLMSHEHRVLEMGERYAHLLRRASGPSENASWALGGLPLDLIDVVFRSSDEFFYFGG